MNTFVLTTIIICATVIINKIIDIIAKRSR